MSNVQSIERHPLKPCIDAQTQVLFLGSFPPPRKRWAKGFEFFYPNFTNDHWRLMGLIFYGDKDYLVDTEAKTYRMDRIKRLVSEQHLGYYDTSEAVRRLKDNASDKFLEVVEQTDIRALISRAPQLRAIAVTGQKAADTLCEQLGIAEPPRMGEYIIIENRKQSEAATFELSNSRTLKLWRLPSSSRAYPMALTQKAEYYRKVFEELKD
ncbi:MAG: uracil-DNA glycosylase family protein [Bacteroidaceae bacterium]|nr:uracil-DNA glycosylase family protein [Bacteroidaceae bacterium]